MRKSKIISLIILALILLFFSFFISANAQGSGGDFKAIQTNEAVKQLKNIQEDFVIIDSRQTALVTDEHTIKQADIHIERFILAVLVLLTALALCIVLATKNGLLYKPHRVKQDAETELREFASDQ